MRRYDSEPTYPIDAHVRSGWASIVATAQDFEARVVALDGPSALDWERVASYAADAVGQTGRRVRLLDLREHFADWSEIERITTSPALREDPNFERLCDVPLRAFLADLPRVPREDGVVTLVAGPGASLVDHDLLWYVSQPKRCAEQDLARGIGRNLGRRQPAPPTLKRLFFVDWPVEDRHLNDILHDIDLWVDGEDVASPSAVAGEDLRARLAELSCEPFRTKPYFNVTPWGGHWAQEELGVNLEAPNTALGYELIAPESGVTLRGDDGSVEFPLHALAAAHPRNLLGDHVTARFGTSFPLRFDYLDTVGGGPLSIHCHPQPAYMQKVFGWEYTQHETYYMMVGGDQAIVYLGLAEGVDVHAFRTAAEQAQDRSLPFDVRAYVQAQPASVHQLFMVPAGTPHGSGPGNVVLEISATPYLYSLRFYDWLRGHDDGDSRPVHLSHAFDNLDDARQGAAVTRDLIPVPELIRSGDGWSDYVIGSSSDVFFDVCRLELDARARAETRTADRFHILNVVAGDGVVVRGSDGAEHELAYAETLIVPAAVESYSCRPTTSAGAMVVRAFVR